MLGSPQQRSGRTNTQSIVAFAPAQRQVGKRGQHDLKSRFDDLIAATGAAAITRPAELAAPNRALDFGVLQQTRFQNPEFGSSVAACQ